MAIQGTPIIHGGRSRSVAKHQIAALLAAVALLVPAHAEEVLTVGLSVPRNRPLARVGAQMHMAAELAVDDLNEQGGIAGRRLELITVDDQCRSDSAAQAATKLFHQEGVRLISVRRRRPPLP